LPTKIAVIEKQRTVCATRSKSARSIFSRGFTGSRPPALSLQVLEQIGPHFQTKRRALHSSSHGQDLLGKSAPVRRAPRRAVVVSSVSYLTFVFGESGIFLCRNHPSARCQGRIWLDCTGLDGDGADRIGNEQSRSEYGVKVGPRRSLYCDGRRRIPCKLPLQKPPERHIIHMEVGQPVQGGARTGGRAGAECGVQAGPLGYTVARAAALRQRITADVRRLLVQRGSIPPASITSGSSAGSSRSADSGDRVGIGAPRAIQLPTDFGRAGDGARGSATAVKPVPAVPAVFTGMVCAGC
jgi:hypothetical protein